jgi:hypothetical protein
MAVDGEQQAEAEAQPEALELAMPSRSQSPLKLGMLGTSPAAAPQQQQHPAPSFVPLSEMGGSACAAAACLGSSDEEPSTRPDRPASAGGYESGDDMDVLSMQHCTNCTGTLWGHICMDCGHMPAHDDELFAPTVAPAAALHRPRLQGDALTVIAWDERMELHEEGGPSVHPERPDRVRAVMARLRAAELAGRCRRLPAREATPAEVQACHVPELLEAVDLLSEQSRLQGGAQLHFSPGGLRRGGGGGLLDPFTPRPSGGAADRAASRMRSASWTGCLCWLTLRRPPSFQLLPLCRHVREPAHRNVCQAVGGRVRGRGDGGGAGRGGGGRGGGAPPRPPRRVQHRHGLLLLQQRRHRGARCAGRGR